MRLIDADALTASVLKWLPPDPCGREEKEFPFETDICASMLMEIEEAPTIEPRPRGRWIDEGFYADGHGAHAFRCSECGGHIIEYEEDPFCRWCGADMREEEQE